MGAALWAATCTADSPASVLAVISREIRPYLLVVESLEASLGRPVTRVYVEDGPVRIQSAVRDPEKPPGAVVAVGPEAADFLATVHAGPPTLVVMVVAVPPWPADSPAPSALVLHIPLEEQLRRLQEVFPDLGLVAVPVGSESTQDAVHRALAAVRTAAFGRVLPLPLQDPPAWSRVLDTAAAKGARAVLFLPEPTLGSTTVIRHVVAEAVLRHLLPIGYNRLFLEAGAGAAFVFDPVDTGRRAAELLRWERFGKEPLVQAAPFRLRLKAATLRHLGMAPPHPVPEGVEVE